MPIQFFNVSDEHTHSVIAAYTFNQTSYVILPCSILIGLPHVCALSQSSPLPYIISLVLHNIIKTNIYSSSIVFRLGLQRLTV